MSPTLTTFLLNNWRTLETLARNPKIWSGTTPKQLKEDLTELSKNRFSILTRVEDEFPTQGTTISAPSPRSKFQASTMYGLGGGERHMLDKLELFERRGGGTDDVLKVLKILDNSYPEPNTFVLPVSRTAEYCGITRGCCTPISVREGASRQAQNLDANPGPTFKAYGFKKKRESISLAIKMAEIVEDKATMGPLNGFLRPRYGVAGRTKTSEKEKFRVKAELLQPFGRAVFMADQHEPLVASKYTVPLVEFLHAKMKTITVGFNKFGNDPSRICHRLAKYNVFINADFSQFDVRCAPQAIARAFEVMRYAFDCPRGRSSPDDHLFSWLEDQFTRSHIVLPSGEVFEVKGGVPSGSGFTALVDSIINASMWQEALFHLGVGDHEIFTHGDDNLIGLRLDGPPHIRKTRARDLLTRASKFLSDNFGHTVSVEKTTIATELYVGFAQPNVPSSIQDGSRKVIRAYRDGLRRSVGRPLTFGEQFTMLDKEPIGPAPGMTHRWTYVFKDRAKFLSHYFKPDPTSGSIMMVRPTAEVVQNLLLPEAPVKTLQDQEDRLVSAWVENMGNHHVTNRIMHYLYDVYILKGCPRAEPGDPGPTLGRFWYRKIDRVVDLLTEDFGFFNYHRELEIRARAAHSAVFGGRYAEWGSVRALRKGRFKTTIGGPLSREPGPGEIARLFESRGFFNSLEVLGFNIWSNPDLKWELLSPLLEGESRETQNHT